MKTIILRTDREVELVRRALLAFRDELEDRPVYLRWAAPSEATELLTREFSVELKEVTK